ncbi:MAG: GNAT family N-acetyltransferase [Pseudomonadota bacterium]|nr:GNAT family N-acetyltransferase [Pseudomonadota bacterium]
MVKVREASPEDCLDIYRWRNDELTRQMSQTTDKVALKDHKEWFAASLKNRRRLLVICEDECDEKIGIVHFEVKGNRALISINIAPDKRGRGLAKTCITEGIALLNSRFDNIHVVKAEIKPENTASQHSFLNANFTQTNQSESLLCFEYSTTADTQKVDI